LLDSKPKDFALAKHLIALRVHLSTANIGWINLFVDGADGLDALGRLLADLVGGSVARFVLVGSLRCAVLIFDFLDLDSVRENKQSYWKLSSACAFY